MPWKFVDKLLADILDATDGDRTEPVYLLQDGTFKLKRPRTLTEAQRVYVGDRNDMYDVIKKTYRLWGVQSSYLAWGDIRATRQAWDDIESDHRQRAANISAEMLDGFNGNMALLRTKLRQWDGDLDVRDVTPGVNNV